MQRTHVMTGLAASVGTLTIAAAFGFAQPDGLEPPAGPVVDTSPSLSSIETKIDQLLLGSGTPRITEGPWQSYFQQVSSNQLSSIEITGGRTLVHKVIVFGSYCSVFDGAGSASGGGANPTANVVATVASASIQNQNTIEAPLDVIVENGLHINWDNIEAVGGSTVLVLYKELP
ncbi:MAG: hypothetical protein AAFO89_02420 [Planctomycetota bacterium]